MYTTHMALFTGKGDSGTTKIFGCDQRISKSSAIAEALGSLDEINSFLGLCKVQSAYLGYKIDDKKFSDIIHSIQKNLFIVQAEVAGATKTIEEFKVKAMEDLINEIEKKMPVIKTFFISGGGDILSKDMLGGAGLGALFDIARTVARRAERRVVAIMEEQTLSLFENGQKNGGETSKEEINKGIGLYTRSYMNRLSSLLYALARYSNYISGVKEESPSYE